MATDIVTTPDQERLQAELVQIQSMTALDRNEILDLVLMKLGFKRATEILLTAQEAKQGLENVKTQLEGLGFLCAWNPSNPNIPGHVLELSVASDAEALRIHQSNVFDDDLNYGKIYGYPQSAVDAFARNDENLLMSGLDIQNEIPEEIRESDYFVLLHFRLSKANWKEELETLKKWHTALEKHAPTFLSRLIKEKRLDLEFVRERMRNDTANTLSS